MRPRPESTKEIFWTSELSTSVCNYGSPLLLFLIRGSARHPAKYPENFFSELSVGILRSLVCLVPVSEPLHQLVLHALGVLGSERELAEQEAGINFSHV
jgi:hypothetical protein